MNSETIINNYGYVLIPKGTFLYRGVKKNSTREYMFFTTKFCDAKSFGSLIQIWKTKSEIKLPFFILYLNHQAKGTSSIPEIYNELFPHDANPNYRDLDIKMNSKREDFIKRLGEINLDGWFSSIEDNTQVEACIFNADKFVEFVSCQTGVETYIYDSLRKIKIMPSERFVNLTTKKLSEFNINQFSNKNPYHLFRSKMRNWVKSDIENGYEEIYAKNYNYNLRLRLKV